MGDLVFKVRHLDVCEFVLVWFDVVQNLEVKFLKEYVKPIKDFFLHWHENVFSLLGHLFGFLNITVYISFCEKALMRLKDAELFPCW